MAAENLFEQQLSYCDSTLIGYWESGPLCEIVQEHYYITISWLCKRKLQHITPILWKGPPSGIGCSGGLEARPVPFLVAHFSSRYHTIFVQQSGQQIDLNELLQELAAGTIILQNPGFYGIKFHQWYHTGLAQATAALTQTVSLPTQEPVFLTREIE